MLSVLRRVRARRVSRSRAIRDVLVSGTGVADDQENQGRLSVCCDPSSREAGATVREGSGQCQQVSASRMILRRAASSMPAASVAVPNAPTK